MIKHFLCSAALSTGRGSVETAHGRCSRQARAKEGLAIDLMADESLKVLQAWLGDAWNHYSNACNTCDSLQLDLIRFSGALIQGKVLMFFYFALFFCFPTIGSLDAPEAWQMGFQDPATPVMQGIIDLHHDICFFMIVILSFCTLDVGANTLSFSPEKEPCSRENYSWNYYRDCLDCGTKSCISS